MRERRRRRVPLLLSPNVSPLRIAPDVEKARAKNQKKEPKSVRVGRETGSALLLLFTFLAAPAQAGPSPMLKRIASHNARLKSLTVSRGKLAPAFKPRHLKYGDRVSHTVNHVLFNALAADPGAQLSIANLGFGKGKLATMVPLFGSSTLILLVVTAEDGETSETYQIKIKR